MHLVVKKDGQFIKEWHFARGPLYIGRQLGSHVCLADLAVSRQHAVLYGADEGEWFIEDLNSANKTYLNDKAVHKSKVNDGDVLKVGCFTVDIQLSAEAGSLQQYTMTDTLVMAVHAPETIIRRYPAPDAPDIKMPPKRADDYSRATQVIYKADSLKSLLEALMTLTGEQFTTFRQWLGLRRANEGAMDVQTGRKSTGQELELNQLIFRQTITEAMEKQQYVLIPLLPKDKQYERTRSALIAPVLGYNGCHGVIYIDNATDQRHYSLSDLDYLVLLAVQSAAVVENLKQAGA